ncbi:hypothetical protein [Cellulosilyticum lentocellum]|uniref:Uncharacterized protein n=1 Tax=Cellulosilyticum lentocellum (strain ATCC 49066 / DSM 5427 / NCIMB 11756 / RHM5) TaxID=642492 RepID=F2JPL2_CELLD|nr:hypothetical protein [Cellulosilyticum lentocellum]ADZ83672.1 hypothetical protein Clole_1954 [Cellulosilyticum lentocellum DSM 5427]
MKYKFSLTRNVYMYNHLLICTDEHNRYEAICESAPTKEETIIFWPDDFGVPSEDLENFIIELQEWAISQGFHYSIQSGKGR